MKKTVWFLLALLAGYYGFHCCLTWDADENWIRFLCRIKGSGEMHLIDNHRQYIASCLFNGDAGKCNTTDFVKEVIEESVVIFNIIRRLKADLQGNWTCLQDDNTFTTEILTSDLTDSLMVDMSGKIVNNEDVQSILLTCTSCRIPIGKNAEFLINNISVNSITFHDHTGKCTYLDGECSSRKCTCNSFGNTFSLFFSIDKQISGSTDYSCDMRFEDKAKSIVFSKVATVSFNGKEFKNRGTQTIISTFADDHNGSEDEENHSDAIIIFAIVFVAVVIVLIFGACLYRKGRKYRRQGYNDEDTKLNERKLEQKEETYKDDPFNDRESELKFGTDEYIPLIGRTSEKNDKTGEVTLFLEYCLQKLMKAKPKCFEIKNEIEFCLKKSNEAQMACRDTGKESWLKEIHSVLAEIKNGSELLLQKFQEIITKLASEKSDTLQTLMELCKKTGDDNDVEEQENTTPKSRDQIIERESETKTEKHEETVNDDNVLKKIHNVTDDEEQIQAQVHMPLESDIYNRTLFKLSENHDSKINRPAYDMDTKLDVIFMNCESSVEWNWVLQVGKVLEDDYHVRCGIPGVDLESFKSVSETSKVIITVSEKSARIPDILKMAEYLPLVVIVMVEDCSIPYQFAFMKCVDATKGVEDWFRNLLIALKIRSPKFLHEN